MPAWPASLPQRPSDNGLKIVQDDDRVSFKPQYGPPLLRRGSTARSYLYTVSFELTEAQKATLESFFETDCLDGTETFTWDDPFRGDNASFQFETMIEFQSWGPVMYHASMTLRRLP